ncbi:hypothetical protein EVAR_48757_1 [Eumeta japonica]|uniref:Uncharacterized protein n=1 Tax=Eumeta variegata TaxID=151549 RepID=A0A4C1YFZ7_EUMVA|nr:hypothetical protein EVAR_48757_1 [Eumeta japonica]
MILASVFPCAPARCGGRGVSLGTPLQLYRRSMSEARFKPSDLSWRKGEHAGDQLTRSGRPDNGVAGPFRRALPRGRRLQNSALRRCNTMVGARMTSSGACGTRMHYNCIRR